MRKILHVFGKVVKFYIALTVIFWSICGISMMVKYSDGTRTSKELNDLTRVEMLENFKTFKKNIKGS